VTIRYLYSTSSTRPVVRISRRGVHGTEHGGVGAGGGSSENIPVFESLRMALVIIYHHKYVQMSISNRTLPICSRIRVVVTTVLKLWPSIIIARHKHTGFKCAARVALWTAAAKLLQ